MPSLLLINNADDNDSDRDYCMPSIRLRVYLFIVQQNALNQLIVWICKIRFCKPRIQWTTKDQRISPFCWNFQLKNRCLGQICSVEKGSPTKRSDVSDIRRAKEHQCGSQGCCGQWDAKSQLRERRTFLKRKTGGQAEISQSVLQTTTSPFWLHRWEAGQRPPFRHFLQVLQLFLCSGIWAPSKNKN